MHRFRAALIGLSMAASVAAAGCGAATPAAQAAAPLYKVTILRDGASRNLPPLRAALTGKSAVLALYRDVYAVKPAPRPFIYMCPLDLGVSYRLTFDLAGKITSVDVDGSGCRFIHLPGGKELWSSTPSGDAFWADLGRILRLSPVQLRG